MIIEIKDIPNQKLKSLDVHIDFDDFSNPNVKIYPSNTQKGINQPNTVPPVPNDQNNIMYQNNIMHQRENFPVPDEMQTAEF